MGSTESRKPMLSHKDERCHGGRLDVWRTSSKVQPISSCIKACVLVLLSACAAQGALIGSSTYPESVQLAAATASGSPPNVLVLGSGGLVGSALVQELKRRGYGVLESRNRMHLDLRVPGALDVFNSSDIQFCFFLACEVGGSKFIASGANERAIWRNNEKMYNAVFPYLEHRGIPFLFSSSQLSVTGTAYGKIKALGEDLVANMSSKQGKFFRFWNVWGAEKIGLKSHILSDWIYQCVKHGHVHSHTSGLEQRQFVHTTDMASALVDLMHAFDRLPLRTDITSGEWVSMRHLAGVLAEHSLRRCTFHFASQNSSTMIGIEPQYLWTVSSDLHQRVSETYDYYSELVAREASAHLNPRPYLSIITSTTNDDYNGIRRRTFHFIQGLVRQAEAAHLDYELIVVQYNPKVTAEYWRKEGSETITAATFEHDLPWSQLFPWTSETSFGRMRIITIPSHLHRWPDQGSFWEYVAKNAGAFRARGRFLLLTNPDDLFPLVLIEQLSKQQLDPKRVYKGPIVLNFRGRGTLSGMLGACEEIAAALYGDVHPDADNLSFTRSQELYQSLDAYTNPEYLATDPELNPEAGQRATAVWQQAYVGDFSIFPKEVFHATSGYAELGQNMHVETGHLYHLTHSKMFQDAGLSLGFMDHVACHQAHTRHGRPAVRAEWLEMVNLTGMHSVRDRLTSGLRGVALPEAQPYDIFAAGYNPETPFLLYPHHHLFRMFCGKLWSGEVQADHITDFLGVKTSYSFDCQDNHGQRYRFFHLSRRIPCARHEEYLRMNYSSSGLQVMGDLPIMDQEYLEWLSLLRAVKRKLKSSRHIPFTVVELGARYGTWTVRAGAAMRALQPSRRLQLLAVAADASGFKWLQEHVSVNGLSPSTQAVKGFVSGDKAEVTSQPWERDSKPEVVSYDAPYSLKELFQGYDHIDIIHCHIQGSEHVFVEEMPLLNAKVAAIHFGTHNTQVHIDLLRAFTENGWRVTRNILDNGGKMPGRVEHTAFGPIKILWDGVLAFENPSLLAEGQHMAPESGQQHDHDSIDMAHAA